VDVRYEPALELFRAAGASVDGRRVRIPARLVDDAVASAPSEWLLKPRGGETEPLSLRDGRSPVCRVSAHADPPPRRLLGAWYMVHAHL
jgi:trimethylamine:corrinoid methyltransferase-like protein